MPSNVFVHNVQAVLFTNPYSMEHKLEFASEMVKRCARVYSSDPNIQTAPQNAPPNVPRIEIRSPDQTHLAQFWPNRISFVFQDTRNMKPVFTNFFPYFRDNLGPQIQYIMEFLNPRVVRLGFIVQFISELGSSSNRFLSEVMLNKNPFPDAHEMNLGILHKILLQSFTVNRWVRYRTLRAQNDPSIDFAMAVDVDINTLAEDMNDFTTSQIMDYYSLSFEHICSELKDFPLLEMNMGDGGEKD
ncbi:MAG TPA: hypothetical protein PLB62_02045 [Candidatus Sumerlaeota bacterium]|nr:hypothetical protein [Candidatus Sumerlaeota bacterium]